ncbi:MOSC domain-containing protein [Roseovarius sp. M141]|uniref:MOSC domain-containing protein n=1 Tax=Roseovarius sp. M141 TaxID=2583806 RepID=UPI0020CB83FE|nr:MOSC domain-containing protein [Roseovarius sp. M141]MCQ0091114.1 MOSC domain-containing protein [Roseovarius sp. M141]
MTARVGAIWRHPIKAHGREALGRVILTEGETIPWDRRWAVAHEQARVSDTGWAPCQNFTRAAKAPQLMAISAVSDEAAGTVTLRHPDRPDLTFDPDGDAQAFLDWVRPLMPEDRAAPARLVQATDRGITDSDFASVSIVNSASSRDLSEKIGQDLDLTRWRANIVLDGLAPWTEREWIGKTLHIGGTKLEVREHIVRCLATAANPQTGERDADTLGALKTYRGTQEFGVYAVVMQGGEIAVQDTAEVL